MNNTFVVIETRVVGKFDDTKILVKSMEHG